jgi:ATP-dependent DNA helicase DinG
VPEPEPVEATAAVLAAAVAAVGGDARPGQEQMAAAVTAAIGTGDHLLVQAGTGTGKSLGYLAPALAHLAANPSSRVVIATATLALQAQLADKDIPAAVAACQEVTGRRIVAAVVKGRGNYACLLRVRDGRGEDQDSLLGGDELAEAVRKAGSDAASVTGAEVVALREWAEAEAAGRGTGDRDAAPSHSPQAWAQVSIPVRECLGASRCPYGHECFAEASRERARGSQLVVTNHALLAIDSLHGGTALPEHDVVVVDEAHELVSRVTGAASHELGPQQLERVARRALAYLADDELGLEFLELADSLQIALDAAEPGRLEDPDAPLAGVLRRVRDVARRVVSGLGGQTEDTDRVQAAAAAKEVFDVAERLAALEPHDVVWVSERDRFGGRQVQQAPLSVAGLIREQIAGEVACVFTSATLRIGGDFAAVARSFGLADEGWHGLDVGSPFDYRRQAILYVARRLPPPHRDGISDAALAEVAELVWAAGGRTLGLFASQRASETAARFCRAELPDATILCQGDRALPELTRTFIADTGASLFGTLSLWQGIDVPGDTCQLVLIDKIPFPRPDDPLLQARQRAVSEAGGNGFMAVAATHAGLLLAQGSGRLIRTLTDRGVVAVLDPRLVTARYGTFLRASMPDFWMTTDTETAVAALRRLAGEREEPAGPT